MQSVRTFAVAIVAVTTLTIFSSGSAWSASSVVEPGDAAVTAFSGVTSGQPRDRIDLEGPSLRVIELPGNGAFGLVNTARHFTAKARQIGQVFGVTLDDQPNPDVFAAATAAYGLSIENPRHDRLRNGEPGAQYTPGLFGPPDQGGGPSSIWRIDGTTGAISLFASVSFKGVQNAPASLGALAFDSQTQQLFVSDRTTGFIHRFGLDGSDRGVFDHGVQGRQAAGLPAVQFNPTTLANIQSKSFDAQNPRGWGFAPAERRIFALAVYQSRLYYSVAASEQIWSVGIDGQGGFASDARFEAAIPALHPGDEVSQISFDANGLMYAAERGAPTGAPDFLAVADSGQNRVVRFEPKQPGDTSPGLWHMPQDEYAVGTLPSYQNANGGVDLSCSLKMWSTGDRLMEPADAAPGSFPTIDGLQGNDSDLVKPANEPPEKSWFIDYYDHQSDPLSRGHVGSLAINRVCGEGGGDGGGGSIGIGYLPPTCPPGTLWHDGFCFYAHCPPGFASVRGECRVPPSGCPPRLERATNGYCRCPIGYDLRDRQCSPRPCPRDGDNVRLQRDPNCCPTEGGRLRQTNANCCPTGGARDQIQRNADCCPPNGDNRLRVQNQNCCPPGTGDRLRAINANCRPPCAPANGPATLRDRNPNCTLPCPSDQKPGTLSIRNPNCSPPCPPAGRQDALNVRNPNCNPPCPPAGKPGTLSIRNPNCSPPNGNKPCPPGTVPNPNCTPTKAPCVRHSADNPDCKPVLKTTPGTGHHGSRHPRRPRGNAPVRKATGGGDNTGVTLGTTGGNRGGSEPFGGDTGGSHHHVRGAPHTPGISGEGNGPLGNDHHDHNGDNGRHYRGNGDQGKGASGGDNTRHYHGAGDNDRIKGVPDNEHHQRGEKDNRTGAR
jgi:hypothetical protein